MKCITVVLTLAFVLAAADAQAVPYILNMSGNNFSTHEPAATGQQLRIAAELSMVQNNPPFSLPGIGAWSREYTVYIHGLTLQSAPGAFQRNYSGGVLEIWSQAPPNAPWTPTTPVGSIPAYNPSVVPARFTDGEMILRGNFSSFTLLDFTVFGAATGSITNTDIDFVAGSFLPLLQAQNLQSNWSWSGWFKPTAPVPSGYGMLYGGKLEVEAPTPVEAATWGRIKALY
jgi:hypothetical protein